MPVRALETKGKAIRVLASRRGVVDAWRLIALIGLGLRLAAFGSGVVNNCTEADLRAALQGGGTVSFACDGVIRLSVTLVVTNNTTVDGTGRSITISGGNVVRVFSVDAGTLTLSNLTIADGMSGDGGGVLNRAGTLRVVGCTFSNNRTSPMDAISGNGGAINSSFNTILEVLNSTFRENSARGGGAIANFGWGSVSGCAFLENHASNLGGAAYATSLWITNSTFFGNRSDHSDQGNFSGAAVFSYAAPVGIIHCTFANNSPDDKYLDGWGTNNWSARDSILPSQSGNAFVDVNHNLRGAFEFLGVGPLADNGGTSLSMALLPGSPAINAADNSLCPAFDQRGVARFCAAPCDIGAFELVTDGPGVFLFNSTSYSASEAARNVSVTVSRHCGAIGDATVHFVTTAGTADPGTDYVATNVVLMFPSGVTEKTVHIGLFDESIIEANEAFGVVLSEATGGTILGEVSYATVTILNDDNYGNLSFDASAHSVVEDEGLAVVTVLRRGGMVGNVSVDYDTSDLSAKQGFDYTSVAGRLSFAEGETAKQIGIPILDNTNYSGNRSFRIELTNVEGGAAVGSPATTDVLILDNENQVAFSASNFASSEGFPSATIDVMRIGWLSNTTTLTFKATDGTATAGADYVTTNGTLTFGPGETMKSFAVQLINDTEIELDETVLLTLENPFGTASHASSATLVIQENDAAVVCNEESLRTALANGGSVVFVCGGTITLSSPITITNDTILDGSGYSVTISGGNRTRLFNVAEGVNFSLRGVTLANGYAIGEFQNVGGFFLRSDGGGGAIANSGVLHLTDCTLNNNTATGRNAEQCGGGTCALPTSGLGGALYNSGTLIVSNCVFEGNRVAGGTGGNDLSPYGGALGAGGAIHNVGTATIVRSTFANNSAAGGGGATAFGGGQLNTSGGAGGNGLGGAVYNAAHLLVHESMFESNSATGGPGGDAVTSVQTGPAGSSGGPGGSGQGGAICHNSSSAIVTASTFLRNTVSGGQGGAGSSGMGSVIFRPTPTGGDGGAGGAAIGGGVSVSSAVFGLTNATFSSNHCIAGNGGNGGAAGYCERLAGRIPGPAGGNGGRGGEIKGGGLFIGPGHGLSFNNTFAGNRGTAGVGGSGGAGGAGCLPYPNGSNGLTGAASIIVGDNVGVDSGILMLRNSILAYGGSNNNCSSNIVDGGNNISSDGSCLFTKVTSRNNTDPMLGPLANNGGATPTMRLLPGSPAVDAGDDTNSPLMDQRSIARPYGWHCDIGAFELIPDFFAITSLLRRPGGLNLRCIGVPNASYRIQESSDIKFWSDVAQGTVSAVGTFEADVGGGAAQFYRIVSP